MLTPTEKIWHNGRFIAWNDARIHVLSHVVSYGSSVFEGIRCYATPSGPAIFRLREHIRRMLDSAKIYRMDNIGYTAGELEEAMREVVRVNKMRSCYIRPILLRAYGEMGVNPLKNPLAGFDEAGGGELRGDRAGQCRPDSTQSPFRSQPAEGAVGL